MKALMVAMGDVCVWCGAEGGGGRGTLFWFLFLVSWYEATRARKIWYIP